MNHKHYRSEQERLDAEKREVEDFKIKTQVNFEAMLKGYPKKFNVSKCLSSDRTFPSCVSPVKAPVEMVTHLELIKQRILPKAALRNQRKKCHSDVRHSNET